MNNFIINQNLISTLANGSTESVERTTLAMIKKNLRSIISSADDIESLTLPMCAMSAHYRDGTQRDFSIIMPILKLLSVDRGNFAGLIENFETAQIVKGCAVIPELAFKDLHIRSTAPTARSTTAPTAKDVLLTAIKDSYQRAIKDLQEEVTTIVASESLLEAYLEQVKAHKTLTINDKDIAVSKVNDFLVLDALKEKIEQIESTFGNFSFTQYEVTPEYGMYKIQGLADTGKDLIKERLNSFGFTSITYMSDKASKDTALLLKLGNYDIITVKL